MRRKGSPPRGRGKVHQMIEVINGLGITPAWAGKRAFQSPPRTVPQDHPRMGGEKVSVMLSMTFWEGSPPHGRGKDPG